MAIVIVKTTVLERDNIDIELEEIKESQDHITAKGFTFESSQNNYIDIVDNEITFHDIINGQKKVSDLIGGGITEEEVIAYSIALGGGC